MKLTAEHRAIIQHTLHRAAGGRYCGDSKEMQDLVHIGVMEPLGRIFFVPEEYFKLTPDWEERLRISAKE
jgi:hypothetical protein